MEEIKHVYSCNDMITKAHILCLGRNKVTRETPNDIIALTSLKNTKGTIVLPFYQKRLKWSCMSSSHKLRTQL